MPFDGKPADYTNTVADVLRRAKALIDTPEKWGQGPDLWSKGTKCVNLAIMTVNATNDVVGHAALKFSEAIGRHENTRWNDDPTRTHAEVMSAFDRAIELAESEGR
jgi:hypothetical protein